MPDDLRWFRDLLDSAKEKAGSRLALSKILGVSAPTISGWEEGSVPAMDAYLRLLKYAGGDNERALPGWTPPTDRPKPLQVVGSVQAGSSSATFQLDETHPDLDFLWRKSSGWAYSRGPVLYIRVVGDSMEPVYPADSMIAVRKWSGTALPRSMPAVLFDKATQGSTLKLYQKRVRGNRVAVIGVPINPLHEALVWRPDDVEIQFVVLGKVEPMSVRELRQNGISRVLRED